MVKYIWILPVVLLVLVAGCEAQDWGYSLENSETPMALTPLPLPTVVIPPPARRPIPPPPPPTLDRSIFDFLTPTAVFYSPLPTPTPTPRR